MKLKSFFCQLIALGLCVFCVLTGCYQYMMLEDELLAAKFFVAGNLSYTWFLIGYAAYMGMHVKRYGHSVLYLLLYLLLYAPIFIDFLLFKKKGN